MDLISSSEMNHLGNMLERKGANVQKSDLN